MKTMESIPDIVGFLKKTFKKQNKSKAVIAVSGGIDSAVALTLLAKSLGVESIYPLFLPYGDQSIKDSVQIAKWNKIPEQNWRTINIKPVVDLLSTTLNASQIRRGNIMARTRMICVFDTAKELDALVCGTENKSEHYLGYFTRFGDAASDIEPISTLYKTQVRMAAVDLGIPEVFLTKAPSAGLWENQTDEGEMGFTYEDADRALAVLLGESTEEVDQNLLKKVDTVVKAQEFKRMVPYSL